MNITQLMALMPMMMLAATIIVVMLGIAIKRDFVLTNCLAAGGILVTLVTLIYAWEFNPQQVTRLLCVDHYALFYMALLLLADLAVLGFCYDYFKNRASENEELVLLLLTALLGASVLVSSSHFASFFLGLEILSISLFVLIGYPLNQPKPLEAAIKYLMLSGVSSSLLLMGMALIYAQAGKLDFNGIGYYLATQTELNSMVLGGIILIISGISFKLSQIPFHLWTPDVYEGAPAPITGFIATVSKGAVFGLLLRYFINTGSFAYTPLLIVFSTLAGLSILGGNLLALQQTNIKRLLAYSSIAHIGYLLIAFIAGGYSASNLVVESTSFYLVAYIITTLGAFGVVSLLSTPDKEADNISDYQGLFWQRPWPAAVLTLMLLSLAGIPLTVGFMGKFYIFTRGANSRLWGLLIALIVGSGLGLYYYLRVIVVMSMNSEHERLKTENASSMRVTKITLAILCILLVWFGICPDHLINLIQSIEYNQVYDTIVTKFCSL